MAIKNKITIKTSEEGKNWLMNLSINASFIQRKKIPLQNCIDLLRIFFKSHPDQYENLIKMQEELVYELR